MTRILTALLLTVSAVLAAGAATTAPAQATSQATGWIVRLGDEASVDRAAKDARSAGADVGHLYRHALKGFAARMTPAQAARVARDPRVVGVEPDRVVRIDSQVLPTGVDRVDGEHSSTVAGDGRGAVDVDVAVIDTGVAVSHPDLDVVGGVSCLSTPSYDDPNGHGTHVAGTAAAADNDRGVVGVAPGARVWAVRVLGSNGSGVQSDVICGLDWVAANASVIEVANVSITGTGTDAGGCSGDAYHHAFCRVVDAGVTVAVSAGNAHQDAASYVPAAYDEVITVSALADFDGRPGGLARPTCTTSEAWLAEDDTHARFSNYGADVDLIAPGVCIWSTAKTGGYEYRSGTSMAAPHVTGAAALYLSQRPKAKPAAVKRALQSAGTLDWDSGDDPDGIKEPLLNVGVF